MTISYCRLRSFFNGNRNTLAHLSVAGLPFYTPSFGTMPGPSSIVMLNAICNQASLPDPPSMRTFGASTHA